MRRQPDPTAVARQDEDRMKTSCVRAQPRPHAVADSGWSNLALAALPLSGEISLSAVAYPQGEGFTAPNLWHNF